MNNKESATLQLNTSLSPQLHTSSRAIQKSITIHSIFSVLSQHCKTRFKQTNLSNSHPNNRHNCIIFFYPIQFQIIPNCSTVNHLLCTPRSFSVWCPVIWAIHISWTITNKHYILRGNRAELRGVCLSLYLSEHGRQ